ncbi:cytochrome c oxidase subunit II [Roseiconus lacunae]|uniref:cytochrome c oxidase subunit II n=1 Tax=Roseiconus lacunae TaxID=2605694 RepID=UPI0011F3C98F|nr:cytochrome c oxidase subunit II [Roseiconus lacunae]
MDHASHSTLNPAGAAAEQISQLFYWMLAGGIVIWGVVVGLAVYAIFVRKEHPLRMTRALVIGGGAVIPTVTLSGLMAYSLSIMPELHRPAPDGSLTIRVSGVRWWWRVEYLTDDGEVEFETANEIRLPVDRPVEFKLVSEDVIHAFWIPALGGKMDMIPGRENRLRLDPTKVGTYGGVCAEYCGTAHAQMMFRVIVSDEQEFDAWRRQQRSDAIIEPAPNPFGRQVFWRRGCPACHTIRGTEADGSVGPDLTHFGSRMTIGAGILPNESDALKRWIVRTHRVKPGVEMPGFESLINAPEELDALVAYLEALR